MNGSWLVINIPCICNGFLQCTAMPKSLLLTLSWCSKIPWLKLDSKMETSKLSSKQCHWGFPLHVYAYNKHLGKICRFTCSYFLDFLCWPGGDCKQWMFERVILASWNKTHLPNLQNTPLLFPNKITSSLYAKPVATICFVLHVLCFCSCSYIEAGHMQKEKAQEPFLFNTFLPNTHLHSSQHIVKEICT